MAFKETMIDHLEIESTIIFAESNEGREQIKKFGRDLQGDLALRNLNILIFFSSDIKDEDRLEFEEEVNEVVKEESKRANHFAFIERASQTKQFDVQDTECQTDPPPM